MEIPTFEDILKQLKTNFWLTGIPFDSNEINIHFYGFITFILLMLIEEICFFVSRISPENFLELTQLAPCMGVGLLSLLKILYIAAKRHTVFKLTSCLDRLYDDVILDTRKRHLVGKEINFVNSLNKYYFLLNAILISVYNFSTLVFMSYYYATKKEIVYSLPYAIIVPFSTDSWPTWLIVYLHSIISGFICVLYFTTVDALYYLLSSQVCINFTILCDDLEHLDIRKEHLDIVLKEIVKRHQYILELSEDLENIFKVPNFFNVVVGSIQICALGFNLTTGDWSNMPGFVLFLLSVVLQILMMSVFGENIMRESGRICEAAYLCKWYEMEKKSKKIMLIIMLRAHKPAILTANKYSVICYGSFTTIISTSWSYFTILKTVYKS